jgi:hypothetical protein
MQKRICSLLVVAALLCAIDSRAQWFVGVEAGANRNYFISNTADKPFFDYQPSYGYSVGASVRYAIPGIASWFGGLQVVPTYIQKNYRIQRTGDYSPMYSQMTNSYLQLPVIAQFKFGGHISKTQTLHGILNLGGYGAYWMAGHETGRAVSPFDATNYESFDSKYAFDNTRDNRVELGAVAGIGLQYGLRDKYLVSVEYRYTPSLTDQQKAYQDEQTPRYNDTHSILLTMQYRLPEGKHKAAIKRK